MSHKRPNPQKLQRLCDSFNAKFPIGTRVKLRKDTEIVETTVKGLAFVLSGHSAVAFFDGVSGAYSIEENRVTPI